MLSLRGEVCDWLHVGSSHLKPHGMCDWELEVYFCRYVDTDVKDDSSDGWYTLKNSIFYIVASYPPLSLVY